MASQQPTSYPNIPSQTTAGAASRGHAITLPGLGPKANNILLWRDPKQSAAYFASATALYILLAWTSFSPEVVVARALAGAFSVTLIWAFAGSLMGRTGPPVPPLLKEGISDATLQRWVEHARSPVNSVLTLLGRLLSGADHLLSLQVIAALVVASFVLPYINVVTLGYTLVLMAFTVPKLYEMNKDQADHYIGIAYSKVKEAYSHAEAAVSSKLPKAQKVH